MRIAFLVDSFPRLSETFILNQMTGLVDLGHEVEIFAAARGNLDVVHDDVFSYGFLNRTHYFNEIPEARIARIRKLVPLFLRYLPVNPTVSFRALNWFRFGLEALSLRLSYRAALFLKTGPFDVLQCHFGTNGLVGASLKAVGIPGRLVTMFHGYDIRRGIREGGRIYRHLFRWGDCFLAISQTNQEHLVSLGADPHKIQYHPVGIDLGQFATLHEDDGVPMDRHIVRVLTVARLVREKGLDDSIHAVAGLLRDRPTLRLQYRIVGDGPERPRLLRLVEDLKLGDAVKFLGPQKHGEVLSMMRQSHLFFLPSRDEVLPVVLMEALACGLPVLATSVGSVGEIVQEGLSGYLVPTGDIPSMSLRLGMLIDHPEKWREMAAHGKRTVADRFDIRKLNQRLVSIYEALQ